MTLSGTELLNYAYEKFNNGNYGEALEAFVLAYAKGHEQEEILDNIYRCYMDGNDAEFRKAFERQEGKAVCAYEDCILDFVPCREGEYFIFDKEEKVFRGLFSVWDLRETRPDSVFQTMEFSDAAWEMNWDFREYQNVLTEAGNRKLYVICHGLKRAVSFGKIPELAEYMDSVRLFSDWKSFQTYFHENTAVYLPKVFLGSEQFENEKKLYQIWKQEHEYRLTCEGRNTSNVFLTIAIPTYNRGHLVLKRLESLLSMEYDAEIEIAISKNGMEAYQEEYAKIGQSRDARIHYHDHGRTLNYVENWRYVVGMARGKYVLLLSDEDDVVVQSLEHYLKLLKDYPDINCVLSKTVFQRRFIKERVYGKKGLEAFGKSFLSQNYLSGMIVRKKDFLQENLEKLDCFSDNVFYQLYPHVCWCALLSQRGDYIKEPVILISEGKSVFEKEGEKERVQLSDEEKEKWGQLPIYAPYSTYEARLEQFKGIIEFVYWLMKDRPEGAVIGISLAISKTEVLFLMARRCGYDKKHFLEWADRFIRMALEAVQGFSLEEGQSKVLFMELENTYKIMWNEHVRLNAEEEKEAGKR